MTKTYELATREGKYKTYDEAVEAGQRSIQRNGYDTLYVTETVAVIKTPTPTYEVVKL